MIHIEGLRAWYPGESEPAVSVAGLKLGQGDSYVVAGPSGSGKTTLILAATGALLHLLEGRVEGKVRLAGVDPLSIEGFRRVPRLVGVVLQDPDKQIAMPTPLDEVSFSLENLGYDYEEAEAKAMKALSAFGLKGKELDPVESLSGGEKRRLTLAAVWAVKPPILMMDEPTASLDPWAVADVRSFLKKSLSEGSAALIVEHKIRYFLDMASEVIIISGGRITASMSPEKAVRSPEELEAMGVDAGEPVAKAPRGSCRERIAVAREVQVARGGRALFKIPEFEACRGEIVAIVGPNGSGKTTFLKILAGALKSPSGDVRVNGRPFYVPQTPDYVFLYPTVIEDLRDAAKRGAGDPWEVIGSSPPQWLSKVSGLHGSRLSLGQRRILSFAIAAAYKPSLLLLDEPSAGLDLRLYGVLENSLRRLASIAAVVVATHDVRLVASVADRVYVIRNGTLSEISKEEAVEVMENAWRRS